MTMSSRPTILISEPTAHDWGRVTLPYMWAVLKTYWEQHGARDAYEWLPPIFLHDPAETLLAPYRDVHIDVLGLSCYVWNFTVQCEIARQIKARLPHCLVVAGGPEPDYKDPDFFRNHPYVDAVAVKDGEITFTRILSALAEGRRDFHDIGGLYLPDPDGGSHVFTGPAQVPERFDDSPYLAQSAFYDQLHKKYGPGSFAATWETNRGCPYACSFCDWGSSTMSRVRRYDMSRITAEAEWLGRMQVNNVLIADANFGMFARDVEIAHLLNDVVRRHGFPKSAYYSAAKNHPERSLEIARAFAKGDLAPVHWLAIQHTRPDVLAATDRANIPAAKQVEVAKALLAEQVPVTVQLILGIPGGSVDDWKNCFGDLMEWGVHEDYDVYFYALLPNAPAADPGFIEKWKIETRERFVFTDTTAAWDGGRPPAASRVRLIVSTSSYSLSEWIDMWVYTAWVKALHNGSLTRLVALYLRLTHGVSYRDFYENLIDEFAARAEVTQPLNTVVRRCYQTFQDDPSARNRIWVDDIADVGQFVEPSSWLILQLARVHDAFYDALAKHLLARYPTATHLAGVLDYQRHMIILPAYTRTDGARFPVEQDWPGYFAESRGRTGSESLNEPSPTPGATVRVEDQTWGDRSYLARPLASGGNDHDRWIGWSAMVVGVRSSQVRRLFQSVRLERDAEDASRSRLTSTVQPGGAGRSAAGAIRSTAAYIKSQGRLLLHMLDDTSES